MVEQKPAPQIVESVNRDKSRKRALGGNMSKNKNTDSAQSFARSRKKVYILIPKHYSFNTSCHFEK